MVKEFENQLKYKEQIMITEEGRKLVRENIYRAFAKYMDGVLSSTENASAKKVFCNEIAKKMKESNQSDLSLYFGIILEKNIFACMGRCLASVPNLPKDVAIMLASFLPGYQRSRDSQLAGLGYSAHKIRLQKEN